MTTNNIIIREAISSDGRVMVRDLRDHILVGSVDHYETSTGRLMWRGRFADPDGFFTDNAVPADLWAAAIALSNQLEAHNNAVWEARHAAVNPDLVL